MKHEKFWVKDRLAKIDRLERDMDNAVAFFCAIVWLAVSAALTYAITLTGVH